VGQAEPARQIECAVEDAGGGKNKGKKMSKRLHVLQKFRFVQLALITPAPEGLNELTQHLPEEERRFRGRTKLLKQLLGLELIRWFVAVEGIARLMALPSETLRSIKSKGTF